MSIFPENGRQVSHVLIDGVMAGDRGPDRDLDKSTDATNLGWQRIAEIEDAYTLTVNENTEEKLSVTLDLSGVLGGAFMAISYLIDVVAAEKGISPEEVAADARRYFDQ